MTATMRIVRPDGSEYDEHVARRAYVALIYEAERIGDRQHDKYLLDEIENLSNGDIVSRYRSNLEKQDIMIPARTPVSSCRWCSAPLYRVPYGTLTIGTTRITRAVRVLSYHRSPLDERAGYGMDHLVDCPASPLMAEEAYYRKQEERAIRLYNPNEDDEEF